MFQVCVSYLPPDIRNYNLSINIISVILANHRLTLHNVLHLWQLCYFFYFFCLTQTSTTIHVHIVDENDNAPEFPEEEYVTVLSEGPDTVGATIATVTAIDPDEDLNGTLRYAITQGNLAQTFHINSITVSLYKDSTGQILTKYGFMGS